MKAIETRYKGYRFRSRLEARWAIFFDVIGIRYEYESEGFVLPSGPYLPDFWLPELRLWGEVKPSRDVFDWNQALELAEHTGREVVALIGAPDFDWYEMQRPSYEVVDATVTPNRVEIWQPQHDWIDFGQSAEERTRQWVWGADDKPSCFSSTDRMDRAVSAARGARFEHGESPRP